MKKIKYNIIRYAIVAGVAFAPFVVTSCRQELDINVDPNNPSTASINSLLSASQVGLGYALGGEGTRMPAAIVQHYAGHRSQALDYAKYEISSDDTEGTWTSLYNVLMDLKEVENKGIESGEQVYVGVSKLLQAYTFSVLTDLYGDIPFSQALKGSVNPLPIYDTQESIYPKLITMIEEGVVAVQSGKGMLSPAVDVVYSGDTAKWVKFGNSLKLRLLNHLSKKDANAARAFLATNPDLIENYADNAKVPFGTTATSANPIYQFDNLSGRLDQAVSSTIVDKMTALSDPRLSLYFESVSKGDLAGKYIGNAPGSSEEDSDKSKYSRVGSAYASQNSPVMLMSAAEVNFIKAEIYQRASNKASAQTAYETAITQDFLALGLKNSDAVTYLANADVAYDNTLQRIMEQKWITMFQASYEAWVDWRRTGFPLLNLPTESVVSSVPRRLPYPTIEISVNRANLEAGPGIPVNRVTYLTPVWWDK